MHLPRQTNMDITLPLVCDKLCLWWDIQIFDSFNVCDNSKVHDIIKAEKEANKEE